MNKILVTGADGFIGSQLVEILLNKGNQVKALSLYNSFNYWGWLEQIALNDNIEIVTGDIRDPFFCKKITKDVDIIFNLAALIAIPYSYVAPASYVETNINGILNLCESALENKCKRIIHTSTSEVYGTAQYVPIDEKHPKQPQSPYSATKIGADALALSYFNSFDLPLTIARPFNTYGPRQSARAIIPTIITQIINGEKFIKVGDTSPTRDFNYVKDTCNGLIAISEFEETIGKEINIASQSEISIFDTINLIQSILKSSVEIRTETLRIRPSKSEVFRLYGDNSLLKQLTGFEPKYSLEAGLKETIDWFRINDNIKHYKADIYNV